MNRATTGKTTLQPIRSDHDFERFISDFTSYERMKSFRYGDETMRLQRMESLVAELGHPQNARHAIHVAGTKGKGTTCLLLEALLSAGGRKVGTYLSPHVEHLRERIRVAEASIREEHLCASLNSMLQLLEARRRLGDKHFPTFFELMTALAMVHFRDAKVDYAIYEVGLGGRLDATNVLQPALTAITGIGLEHTQTLGSTLTQIAKEKAGIIKPGVPVAVGKLPDEARQVIESVASSREAELIEASSVTFVDGGKLKIEPFRELFSCGAVRGPGLRSDLAVALTLWLRILDAEGVEPCANELQRALESVSLPARVESLEVNPPVLLDGAHTVESIQSLGKALEEIAFPRPRTLVVSIASDKRIDEMLEELRPLATAFVFTCCDAARSESPNALAKRFRAQRGNDELQVHTVNDPVEALEVARSGGRPVVVTGSMYLTGAVRRFLRGR